MIPYRLALVTGATSGIGKEVSKLLANQGIGLILTGRNHKELLLLQKSLSVQIPISILASDLETTEGRAEVIRTIHEKIPDLVINNAGFGLLGNALNTSTQEQTAILEVNCKAVLEISLEAARALIAKNRQGVVLNVSSAAAFQYFPGFAVYSASKSFVDHFSQAFDQEVKPFGIRVLTIYPGFVDTPFSDRAGGKKGENRFGKMTSLFAAKQIVKQIEQSQPIRIIDWKMRVLYFLSQFVPLRWKASLGKRLIDGRINAK